VASEQSNWNQPRQWKRTNETRIATWNVRTLHRAGAMSELVKEIDKYNVYIYIYIYIYVCVCALQEIRWPGKGTVIKKNYMIVYSGHKVTDMNVEQHCVLVDVLWIIC
jgi:hypothetical protein